MEPASLESTPTHGPRTGSLENPEVVENVPGHVIPMLPEILSNGVCSLQEGVPRLCKSVFITYDDEARPVSAQFANTIIKSSRRLRYREAQALIDGSPQVPHPEGNRAPGDYDRSVVALLHNMNALARRLQKRRLAAGQIVLDLPEVELVLDEDGKIVDAVPEDQSFTHTLIEMFMVEANEAVGRLLDSQGVPFLRRTHPDINISGQCAQLSDAKTYTADSPAGPLDTQFQSDPHTGGFAAVQVGGLIGP